MFNKAELRIMMTAYNAWIMEQPFGLTEEFRALYSKYF